MQIAIERLKPEILQAIIEEYVTREATDYGEHLFSLEEKVAQVRRQLERGQAQIVFDPESETCDIVTYSGRAKGPA